MSMSERETRPGELSRIAQDEIKSRVEVLTRLGRIEDKIDNHIADDTRQFTELKTQYRGVSSGVNEYKEDKQQIIGARKLISAAVLIIAAIYGAAMGVIEIVKLAVKP